MTEIEAFDAVCAWRWPNGPVCPHCRCRSHYLIATRLKFKCAGCKHQFSPTSGTVFHATKLAYRELLTVLEGRPLHRTYKTNFRWKRLMRIA
jgi:transposase-like protein